MRFMILNFVEGKIMINFVVDMLNPNTVIYESKRRFFWSAVGCSATGRH